MKKNYSYKGRAKKLNKRYNPPRYLMTKEEKMRLDRLPKIETKFHQYVTGTPVLVGLWTGSTPILLNSMAQGTSDGQRIGDRVSMIGFTAGIVVQGHATAQTRIRCMVINAKENARSSVLQTSLVLQSPTYITSLRNMDGYSQFRVYYDELFQLDPNGVNSKTLRINIPFKDVITTFQAAGVGGANILTNALYFYIWSDNALGANNPSVQYMVRVRWKDV